MGANQSPNENSPGMPEGAILKAAPEPAGHAEGVCYWNGVAYSTGAKLCIGDPSHPLIAHPYYCQADGSWKGSPEFC